MTPTQEPPDQPEASGVPEGPDAVPQAVVHSTRRTPLSLVWIIPLLAAVIGVGVALQAYLKRGPVVQITFQTADGIEAGKTRVRYRNVDVGEVRSVTIAPDRTSVVIKVEFARGAAALLVKDTRFWVVRPRIVASGVSGLGTLLSGSYIGMDMGRSEEREDEFTGLEVPPAVTANVPGREFILHSETIGSLDIGAALYYRRIQVGEVASFDLDSDGGGVTLRVFVRAPYDRFVCADTRFWHASGVDISLDANGLRVETESLASLLAGGIAFETPRDAAELTPAAADAQFLLASTRDLAMKTQDHLVDTYRLVFNESLHGLSVGAPVDFRGVEIGDVRSMQIEYDPVHEEFRFPVTIDVYPERIRKRYVAGSPGPDLSSDRTALVARMIDRGFRAQLRTGNLLTGQQYVALDFFPSAPPLKADRSRSPLQIPTLPGGLQQLQDSLGSIARKVDALPIERIGANLDGTIMELRNTLAASSKLVQRLDSELAPQAQGTLADAQRALRSADRLLSSDTALQTDLRQALKEVSRAAAALGSLADYLDEHPEALIRGRPAQSR